MSRQWLSNLLDYDTTEAMTYEYNRTLLSLLVTVKVSLQSCYHAASNLGCLDPRTFDCDLSVLSTSNNSSPQILTDFRGASRNQAELWL